MDLNKKLKELKPQQLNCNVFDVYSYNGLTMQDLLCQFFTKINECITVSNETIDLAKWLVNEGLEIEVVKKLMIWLEDGTLKNIINVNIFNTLNEKVNGLSSQVEHIANKGTTVEVLERVTKEEIERQINDGTIANLTIEDNSITNSKIKDSEIKPNKTSFVKYTKNIFDKDSVVLNSFLDAITGNEIYNDRGWRTTPFIEVEENTLYTANFDIFNRNSFEYDENYNMIRKFSEHVGRQFTTGSKTKYIRLSIVDTDDITYHGIVKGSICFEHNRENFIEFGYIEIPKLILQKEEKEDSYWKGKNVVVFGDSISTDYYANYPKWATFLQNDMGFNLYNNSVHAVGYKCGASSQEPDENTLSRKIESFYTQNQDLKVDLVIVFMGINDFIKNVPLGSEKDGMDDSFEGAVKHCMGKLIEYWYEATIVIFTPLLHNWDKNILGLTEQDYSEIIRKYAKVYSYPVLDLTTYGSFYPNNEKFANRWTWIHDGVHGDGVHPNQEFQEKVIARKVKSFLSSI